MNDALRAALSRAALPTALDDEPIDMRDKPEEKDIIDAKERMKAEEIRAKELEEQINIELSELPREDASERSRYIPLRLSYEERKSLRLVIAAVNVSDYTTFVDVEFRTAARRQHLQLQQIVAFLTGLVASYDYSAGQALLEDRNFGSSESQLREVLEVARRYKITNPEKLRSEYGKLMYLMQDAKHQEIAPLLGVDVHAPIHTVYSLLAAKKGLALLADEKLATATQEILPDKSKSRGTIQAEIRRKEKAIEQLCRQYSSPRLSADEIRHCLYSICDNNSFLNSNLLPIVQCIELLERYFHPSRMHPRWSLDISEGSTGARLSHTHETQFNYVLQSLHLWAAIVCTPLPTE